MKDSHDKHIDEILGRLGQVAKDQATVEQSGATEKSAFDSQFIDRVTDAVIEQQEAESPRSSNLIAPRRRRPQWAIYAPAAAVILALGVVLFQPSSTPLIADYSLSIQGIDQQLRGLPETRIQTDGVATKPQPVTVGNQLVLTLRPDREVTAPIHAALWRARAGQTLAPIPVSSEIAPNGAVRFRPTLGDDLALPVGEQTLWIVVSNKAGEPTPQQLGQLQKATQTKHWYAAPIRLRIRAATSTN